LFVAVALAVMACVTAFTLLTPPQYEATAEVMLSRRNAKVTTTDNVVSALPADSSAVDTEVEILKSPQLAKSVVRALRLQNDPEFQPRKRPETDAKAIDAAVERVRNHLTVSRSGLTYVMDVNFTSREPAKAAAIANTFARLYLAQQVDDKVKITQNAADWLSGQLNLMRRQVTADESAVQQFKIANNLMSSEGTTLTEQELSSYNQSLAQAKTSVAEDAARLDTARRQLAHGSTGDDVGESLNSPTIQKLREQRAEVSRRVAALRTNFQEEYPELKKARNELADYDSQIQAEIGRIISNLDAKAQVSRQRAAAVAATVGGAKGQLASNNRASVQLGELERNAQASRAVYESYLARYKETSSQVGLAEADARLVSAALTPLKPSSPNLPLNLSLGLALATAAGLAAVGVAQMAESGVGTAADVEKRFGLRYLGAIPSLHSVAKRRGLSPTDYIVEHPLSGFSEAYRSVVASILHGGDSAVKVVAVTSALPGEGKTTTSVCLARAAALQGHRVVVVDCDLRRRTLTRLLPHTPELGLLELLENPNLLSQAIVPDSLTSADILPLGDAPPTLADVFGSPAMDRLLGVLRSRYDLVVLDTPPLAPVADSRVLAQKADFTAVVARWRSTPYQAIQAALQLLSGSDVALGGMVLNQVDLQEQMRNGYGDLAYYFSTYGGYYIENGRGRGE